MVAVPNAIIFVNNDLTDQVKDHLVKQLFIDIILTGDEFDSLILTDPEYHLKVKKENKRIMVIRSFGELDNREKADIVVFIKEGMAAIEKNKYGPPGDTFLAVKLHWGQLGVH